MERNIVVIDPVDTLFPKFADVDVGTLFRYKHPWNENNVYMKVTSLFGRCVLLNTGTMYDVGSNREIVPVRGLVSIQNPV